ncbi:hypothetical protein SUDANB56_06506 (plasmid) [Streptomyces sp. enrichment culture]
MFSTQPSMACPECLGLPGDRHVPELPQPGVWLRYYLNVRQELNP